MNAIQTRLAADLRGIEQMAAASGGQLRLLARPTALQARYEFELRLPLAGNRDYPQSPRTCARLAGDLPSRYPFEPPVARLLDGPLLHPNVFESGVVCVGSRWQASEGLDLFVRRVARLLVFDPLLVNLKSLANAAAAGWYRDALRRHPQAFPGAQVNWPLEGERTVVRCPGCGRGLQLPSGRAGQVQCPACSHEFAAQT